MKRDEMPQEITPLRLTRAQANPDIAFLNRVFAYGTIGAKLAKEIADLVRTDARIVERFEGCPTMRDGGAA